MKTKKHRAGRIGKRDDKWRGKKMHSGNLPGRMREEGKQVVEHRAEGAKDIQRGPTVVVSDVGRVGVGGGGGTASTHPANTPGPRRTHAHTCTHPLRPGLK